MEQEVLTFERACISREEVTRERLSALICQKGLLTGGTDDCYWVLLADLSTDSFVILEGIHKSCLHAACNDEFQLVAVGSAASEDGCEVYWPGAKGLARTVHKIMRKKRNATDDSEILKESAIHGLLIYHLVGCEARFRRDAEDFCMVHPWSVGPISLASLEDEMQMLPRVLKPPSVLNRAASPSLLAQGPFDDTASSSSTSLVHHPALAHVSEGMSNNPSETAGYEVPGPGLAMYPHFATHIYCFSGSHRRILNQGGDMNMIMTPSGDGNLLQELAAAPSRVLTRSSGRRGINGGGVSADYDLEAGGEADRVSTQRTSGGATPPVPSSSRTTGPVQEPSEIANKLEGVMVQAYAAFLPACAMAYPLFKDAPDHVKFTIFVALAFITVGLFFGILSPSVARRRLAMRLVSFFSIAVLTLSVASQLSSRTYIAVTALVGVAVNFVIMLLPFN